jgi:hypothetical protein
MLEESSDFQVKTPYDSLISTIQTSISNMNELMASSQSTAISLGEAETYTASANVIKAMNNLFAELRTAIAEREKWIAANISTKAPATETSNVEALTTNELLRKIKPSRLLNE